MVFPISSRLIVLRCRCHLGSSLPSYSLPQPHCRLETRLGLLKQGPRLPEPGNAVAGLQ